jgi:hypothetical protein
MNNILLFLLLSRVNPNIGNIAPMIFNRMGLNSGNMQAQLMNMLGSRMGFGGGGFPMANIMGTLMGNRFGNNIGNMLGGLTGMNRNGKSPMPINRNFFDKVNKSLAGMDPEKKKELLDIAKSVFKN